MNYFEGDIQDYVDSLERDAEEIEKQANEFFKGVETKLIRSSTDAFGQTKTRKRWRTPEGSTKEIQRELRSNYEIWCTKADNLVKQYLPQRLEKFRKYRSRIEDGIELNRPKASKGADEARTDFIDYFDVQRNMVKSIPAKIEAEEVGVRRRISKRIERDGIQQARKLLENDFIRASGVVASVSLERHLLTMCENSESVSDYEPNHGINRLSQTLYEAGEIDKTTWNDLKALASIRETCAHPEEPNKPAVQRLIDESEDFIQELRI